MGLLLEDSVVKIYFLLLWSNKWGNSIYPIFIRLRYIRANTLMNEMDQAKLQDSYMTYLNALTRLDLLVIDDFGLMDLDLNRCRDLFEVIDSRDSLRSTMVVSQLPVSSWYELFADSTYADACLDRMIHKAYRLELNGKNMRNPK